MIAKIFLRGSKLRCICEKLTNGLLINVFTIHSQLKIDDINSPTVCLMKLSKTLS